MASDPLQAPELAVAELERAHGLGLRSVMIPPNIQHQALDEAQFEVFWEAAEALGVLVFIHPFDAMPSGLLARYNLGNLAGNLIDTGLAAAAIMCGGVLERHPDCSVPIALCSAATIQCADLHILLPRTAAWVCRRATKPQCYGLTPSGYLRNNSKSQLHVHVGQTNVVGPIWFAYSPLLCGCDRDARVVDGLLEGAACSHARR